MDVPDPKTTSFISHKKLQRGSVGGVLGSMSVLQIDRKTQGSLKIVVLDFRWGSRLNDISNG